MLKKYSFKFSFKRVLLQFYKIIEKKEKYIYENIGSDTSKICVQQV